jgi:hypothetical protein
MGARGNWEREIAAAERDQAAMERMIAAGTAYVEDRVHFEQEARWHDEAAELHERLAVLYDRKDGAPGGEHVVDLREVVDVRAPESSPVEEHDSTG